MTRRAESVNNWIRKIAADYIRTCFEVGLLVSVSHVETSPDLKNASIFVSVFPEARTGEVEKFLEKKSGDFKNYAKSFLKIKFLPEFKFRVDKSAMARQKIEDLLAKAGDAK